MNLASEKLTVREEEVYKYILQGLSNPEIADILCISIPTVVTHIQNICIKKLSSGKSNLMATRIRELEEEIKNMRGTNSNTGV